MVGVKDRIAQFENAKHPWRCRCSRADQVELELGKLQELGGRAEACIDSEPGFKSHTFKKINFYYIAG